MKAKVRFSVILMFLFTAFLVNGQEPQKSETTPSGSGTKAQDHNSTRSNKTASSVAPDNNPAGGDKNTPKENQGKGENGRKKGYDYYQSQSEMQNKAQDQNSSRSNKTASKVADDPNSGDVNSKSIDDKTNKSEAARAKKK